MYGKKNPCEIMRTRVRRQCFYDARVGDVNLEEITSSVINANHLRALRDDRPDNFRRKICLMVQEYDDHEDYDFVIREGDDLGWLGYFIRRSKRIESISILSLPENRERIDALIEGIAHNQSIHVFHFATEYGYQSFERMECILRSGKILNQLGFCNINTGRERAQNIASILGQVHPISLNTFLFHNNTICDEGFAIICGELRSHPQLEKLSLYRNDIGRNGCMALGNTLSSWHAPNLQSLDLEYNSIDDLGLQALVAGIMSCSNLSRLILSGNRSITTTGLRLLSTLFQPKNCSLEELSLERINIGNDGAAALAEGLVGNKSLKQLHFDVNVAGITEVGWSAFSKLLCDTSSINNTYLSNHTLEWIGESDDRGAPEDVAEHLEWNIHSNRNEHNGAIWKILKHHHEFDVKPMFRWKLKFLPLFVTWFEERLTSLLIPRKLRVYLDATPGCKGNHMKLSAIYKFVRGMPLLIIDGYNSRRTNTRMSRKRRLDGETK